MTNESAKIKQFACVVLALYLLTLTGCTNWQGTKFCIGTENYNGAAETKTFVKEAKNERPLQARY